MANINNANNFYIKPPKFSWLEFSYSQDKLNDDKSIKNTNNNKTINIIKDEKIESRSQSFIELTKLLTDDCQYGILDEYAGTKEEREKARQEKELKKQKRLEKENAEKENAEKEREEKDKNEEEKNEEENEIKKQEKKKENRQSIIEKIVTNSIGKIDFRPFSAPVNNNEKNLKIFENLIKRNSFDNSTIQLNEPIPENNSSEKKAVSPLNDISIFSNNNNTTIEIKTPKPKENDLSHFKSFLNNEYDPSKDDDFNTNNDGNNDNNEVSENNNRAEKFKTSESSTSLNVLLENIDIKYSSDECIPKTESIDSLESIDFGSKKIMNIPIEKKKDESWISNISKSFQSWMNQKTSNRFEYFTKTDKQGNIKILSVNSIMELYDFDYEQACSIHEYISTMLSKDSNDNTGNKFNENFNKNINLRENKTLELIYKSSSINPIITSDLALKLQNQLPKNLHNKFKWTMQFSLSSINNSTDSSNDILNLRHLLDASNNHGPCLIIIQDYNNYIFGAFINEELRNDMSNLYGSNECFLWKYKNSELEVFRPIEDCNDLIYSNSEFLSIGG
eukprot:jgi/Orpsp1_1/1184016/evm.model.c7180000087678.1